MVDALDYKYWGPTPTCKSPLPLFPLHEISRQSFVMRLLQVVNFAQCIYAAAFACLLLEKRSRTLPKIPVAAASPFVPGGHLLYGDLDLHGRLDLLRESSTVESADVLRLNCFNSSSRMLLRTSLKLRRSHSISGTTKEVLLLSSPSGSVLWLFVDPLCAASSVEALSAYRPLVGRLWGEGGIRQTRLLSHPVDRW